MYDDDTPPANYEEQQPCDDDFESEQHYEDDSITIEPIDKKEPVIKDSTNISDTKDFLNNIKDLVDKRIEVSFSKLDNSVEEIDKVLDEKIKQVDKVLDEEIDTLISKKDKAVTLHADLIEATNSLKDVVKNEKEIIEILHQKQEEIDKVLELMMKNYEYVVNKSGKRFFSLNNLFLYIMIFTIFGYLVFSNT